jgi:hypothetical protein
MNPETNVQEPFPGLSGLISYHNSSSCRMPEKPRLGHEPKPAFMRAEIKLDLITGKMPDGAKMSAALRARCDASVVRLNRILPLVRNFGACIVY